MGAALRSVIRDANLRRFWRLAGLLAALMPVPNHAQSLPAQLQVVPSCRFQASSAVMSFGSVDATRTAPAATSIQLGYRCTRGVVPVVALGPGINFDARSGLRQLANGDSRIPYDLSVTGVPAPGAGLKATLNLTVTGSISVAAMQAASAGSYADTVVLNIAP